jgi:MFS family permease
MTTTAAKPRQEPLLVHVAQQRKDSHQEFLPTTTASPQSSWTALGPGLGLLAEAYMLFSVGTLQPLWETLFPACFGRSDSDASAATCSPGLVHALPLAVVGGLVTGMLGISAYAQHAGRRRGSLVSAGGMAAGALALWGTALLATPSEDGNGANDARMLRCLVLSFFLFGVGVGGEYPLAASRATEDVPPHEASSSRSTTGSSAAMADRHRGRRVQLAFSMQGLGILLQCSLLTLLLVLFDSSDNPDAGTLLHIWQGTYGVGAFGLVALLVHRCLYLPESQVWQDDKATRALAAAQARAAASLVTTVAAMEAPPSVRSSTSDVSALSAPSVEAAFEFDITPGGRADASPHSHPNDSVVVLLLRHYGMRLVGVSSCWFLWDVAFYGNKLFQASFLMALWGNGEAQQLSLVHLSGAATVNAAVAYAGYLAAAVVVDRVGRRSLQLWGFLGTGVLFCAMGLLYPVVSSPTLVVLYLASSFLGQLGPNATTFCLPAEIFPTQVRTTCHGWAAAAGKAGAMVAALGFPLVTSELDLFLVSGYASLAACAITFWTIPETCGLDLRELDVLWSLILTGRAQDYHGPAHQARFLSAYERHRGKLPQQLVSEQHYNHAMDDF